MSRRDEVLEKIRQIPSLPTAAMRVVQLLKEPEVEITDLMESISYDPGLTSNVLRLANSAYFGGPRTIASLREAILRLGTNRIFQLVITAAVAPIARQPVRGYDLPAGGLLSHAISVAIGAETLAAELQIKPPPSTFTAGLLHDIGKVVLGTFLELDAAPIVELAYRQHVSFEIAEAQVIGIDHAETGAGLLEHWNLPSSIVDVARLHHCPEQVVENPLMVDLVHVADQLSMQIGIGSGVDGLNYVSSPTAIARLKVNEVQMERVACHTADGLEMLREFFGGTVGR